MAKDQDINTEAARIDHARTHVYSVDRNGLWWLVLSDDPGRLVINRAMKQAQDAVEAAAQDERLIPQAQDRAERVLRGAFETIGWEMDWDWTGVD